MTPRTGLQGTGRRRDFVMSAERKAATVRARQARVDRDAGAMQPGFGEPLQYDESGFPIAQHRGTFAERVRRLLSV